MTHDDRNRPIEIRQESPRELEIRWADGAQTLFPVRELRLACRCALCVDEWTGENRLDSAQVADDIRPVRVRTVGRYALNIVWSDGHESGIYPFERLRDLAQRLERGVG
ncbi:MAG: DUF971 domain-containing protein [Myxococcota bacterium]